MAAKWLESITGSLEDKKRYRQYKARTRELPANYRAAIEAVDRYLMYYGGLTDGTALVSMLWDLLDLFEQSVADRMPIRDIVGDDPVEFVEAFVRNYSESQWINKERERLVKAIDRATGESRGK